jgi:hypothetical protein
MATHAQRKQRDPETAIAVMNLQPLPLIVHSWVVLFCGYIFSALLEKLWAVANNFSLIQS